ncbi:MAG: hypothetical protein QM774_06745 [Gordonia sp. (in: high G+C Gram-positive bacteria)]|uniref:hypothetical protein n=1 Tax=Gordonia sp. (in: high G+C Gram-positive bacteria) TaxID=84139 RepID=UPI0039E3E1DD
MNSREPRDRREHELMTMATRNHPWFADLLFKGLETGYRFRFEIAHDGLDVDLIQRLEASRAARPTVDDWEAERARVAEVTGRDLPTADHYERAVGIRRLFEQPEPEPTRTVTVELPVSAVDRLHEMAVDTGLGDAEIIARALRTATSGDWIRELRITRPRTRAFISITSGRPGTVPVYWYCDLFGLRDRKSFAEGAAIDVDDALAQARDHLRAFGL